VNILKKVGIITINDNDNYGNRLQNYATQEIIRSLGFQTYNIQNYHFTNSRNLYYLRLLKNIFSKKNRMYSEDKKRRDNFIEFNKNIKQWMFLFSPFINYKSFDYLIAGSDQIWNPKFGLSDATLLKYVQNGKKIALSASFGVDNVCVNSDIVRCINDFKYISVREKSGAEIVKKLTGRNAEVLIDPTMMLSQSDWSKVSKKPEGFTDEGYVLTYFLSPKNEVAQEQLREMEKDRYVYELMNKKDKIVGSAGPAEFLWLFAHADLIFTDSFHACIFSFLFDKPFVVYDRNWNNESMNSRIETLLTKFHLERKYANSGLENNIWEHNYSEGYEQLKMEQEKVKDFLRKALEV